MAGSRGADRGRVKPRLSAPGATKVACPRKRPERHGPEPVEPEVADFWAAHRTNAIELTASRDSDRMNGRQMSLECAT